MDDSCIGVLCTCIVGIFTSCASAAQRTLQSSQHFQKSYDVFHPSTIILWGDVRVGGYCHLMRIKNTGQWNHYWPIIRWKDRRASFKILHFCEILGDVVKCSFPFRIRTVGWERACGAIWMLQTSSTLLQRAWTMGKTKFVNSSIILMDWRPFVFFNQ